MNLKCGRGGEAVCGQRGRKFNNVKAGMHTGRYITRVTPAEDLSCLNGVAAAGRGIRLRLLFARGMRATAGIYVATINSTDVSK